jgi:hypothetical protein
MKLSTKRNHIGKNDSNFDSQSTTRDRQNVDFSPLNLVNHVTASMPFVVAQFLGGYQEATKLMVGDWAVVDSNMGGSDTLLTAAKIHLWTLVSPDIFKAINNFVLAFKVQIALPNQGGGGERKAHCEKT